MIPSKNFNYVYISELLSTDPRFSNTCKTLCTILDRHAIPHGFLAGTKDIWCRDYMPVQVHKDKFVQFRYEPSYLENEQELQSNPKEVCQANDIAPQFSNVNLDGGNIVNWSDRAIISDKVFTENPDYTRTGLISELEKLLEAEIIVIPQINSDMTGHADGMLRFRDQNTLIGNHRDQEYKYWRDKMNKVLQEKQIDYIDIPFLDHKEKKYPEHAIGCYMNFLEVQDLIILPKFETPDNKDREVYETFQQLFPDRKIEQMNFNPIALHGGLMNCVTWTVEK